MTKLTVIVLAAGDGTRMKSSRPKLLHTVGALPIISHVVGAAAEAGAANIGVITGAGAESVEKAVRAIAPNVTFFLQSERRGTAHAAMMAEPMWRDAEGYIAVVYGDHPLLTADIFDLVTARLDAGMDAAILGFEPKDPTGYGRLLTDGEQLLAIREHKDATDKEREVGLCNACILAFKADIFRDAIAKVDDNNAQGEYYLGDLVQHATESGKKVGFAVAPWQDVLGVNSQSQLAEAENLFQNRQRENFMQAGVWLMDPASTYFAYDTIIAADVVIEPNVFIGPGVEIGAGARIHAFSHLEGARIGADAMVGPFARLRPGTNLGANAKAGNFVEVKNASIGEGAKLNHLSYIGDAEVGANSNLGAGTITCNYDGYNKHLTRIGSDVFVGSNTSLVAPVSIADSAYIASGSVITADVPTDTVAFGRARQENKDGYAKIVRARAAALKKSKQEQ